MKIVTAEQMRRLEQRAADAGITEDMLMETAGLTVARRIAQLLDGIRGKRIVVLVGPGNNGGDGMVAARYLADWGALVTLYMTTPRRREDKFEECRSRRVRVVEAQDDADQWQMSSYVPLADVVLDAVLGIGAGGRLEGPIRQIIASLQAINYEQPSLKLVALDIPTGLDADTGTCDEVCFPADITLTLAAPKLGLFCFPGARWKGRVETLAIGIPEDAFEDIPLELADDACVRRMLPPRPMDGHKGTFGHLVAVAGARRFVGAPVLVTSGAYRAGAGLVTLAAPESAYRVAAGSLLEQVHILLPETADGYLGPAAAEAARAAVESASAAVVGPGMGNVESVQRLLQDVLLSGPLAAPVVIDADAINCLAQTYGWPGLLQAVAVLTPHPGEMSRLLRRPVTEIQDNRVETAQVAAADWGQVVVLKGAHTVVAAPNGRTAISPFANPALASGGTGDVLSGVIGALLAQGAGPYEAAVAGVYVHGAAGERVRAETGDAGLLASDLLPHIPRVLRDIRRPR
ncbi:MAG: NAD(P)H-hydrate dehydratase [Dehalococcoidia bacterium]